MSAKHNNASDVAAASEVKRLLLEDTTPWYRKPNLFRLYLILIPAALGVEMTTGYDGSVLNGLQAVDLWNEHYGNPHGAIIGVITSSLAIGTAVGVLYMPYINDRFGRKFCVILGSIVVAIGVVIQSCAVNVGMLIASRIIMGLGSPLSLAGAAQLVVELAYPKERSTIVGCFQGTWYAGAILAAGVTLGTYDWANNWSWRLPTLLQILPSVLTIIFIWFVPESPRWLVSKDRHEEALQILIKYHAEGDETSAFVAADSYYLAKILALVGITSRATQNQLNVGLNCWNLVTALCSSWLAGWVLRRRQLMTAYLSLTILFSCYTACSAVYAGDGSNKAAAIAVVALIFLFNAGYNLMQPFQYLYIGEIFPFIQRSKGIAVMQMSVTHIYCGCVLVCSRAFSK
ncbi:hypothetical protein QQX98_002342 [Neonectria punicea]|uniref:Major facilitator superfamily (MFS) profile domain-containing protein n=1 Tax=Neonectria punicea TaxID=979145 RepID=A0ABR1HJ77_9HYPO